MSFCLITGSNGGIGSAVVESLLRSDKRDIVCHFHSNNEDLCKILEKYDLDPKKRMFEADLTNEAEVKSLHEKVVKSIGPVSSIVNIVGGSTNGMSWKLRLADFRRVIDLNLTSTFLVCKQFIPSMRENNFGRIINTSSVVAFSGAFGASHYGAAKAAVAGFSKSIALELANKNITVNTLALGYFNAGLIKQVPENMQSEIRGRIPFNRFGDPQDVGKLINFILSKEAGYITGQTFHINGGLF